MPMSHQRADTTLNAVFVSGTPFLQLHTGDPGAAGTANIAQISLAAIARKAITFAAPGNHATNTERRILSNAAVAWTGAQIDAAQNITHATIWSAVTAGTLEDAVALGTPKTTGSDGVTVPSGDIEVAYTVYVKP